MPDAARPDRSGLLVSIAFERAPRNCFEGVAITLRLIPAGDAIENGMAAAMLNALCDQLVPVWFSDGSQKMLLHPKSAVADLVLSGEPAPDLLSQEVAEWRGQYGIFADG